jgi:hypothetical protein
MNFLSWILTTNKGEKQVNVPTSWAGVTLKQYAQLVTVWDGSDLLQLFSILSGLSVKTLNETVDPALYESLEISTRFIYDQEPPFKKAEKPKTITVNGKTLEVPANLNGLTIGQSIMVRQEIDKAKNYEEVMAMALACYFQNKYDDTEEFNSNRALDLLPHFENMPVGEGYGIAVFLLRPLMRSGKSTGSKLNHLITHLFTTSLRREAR